jgi:hypothetical protein
MGGGEAMALASTPSLRLWIYVLFSKISVKD